MSNMKKILSELYKIDPELKKQEAQLKALISKMMEIQPNAQLDKAFAER